MSYSFQSMTDEELEQLLDNGIYDFQVKKSERKISSSNNPMAKLTLSVWDKKGVEKLIFDYLIFSSVPLNIKKVKHFCDAVGLQEEYKKGSLPEDLSNLSGKLEIGTQDEQPKEGGGYWAKKNIVVDYIKSDYLTEKFPVKDSSTNNNNNDNNNDNNNKDEDIPF